MSDIELHGKIVCVFGLPNTGKTNLMRWMLRRPPYRRNFIFDPVRDYSPDEFGLVYRPESRKHSSRGGRCDEEFDMVMDKLLNSSKPLRPRVVMIDEANRVAPNVKGGIPPALDELVDFNTHYDPEVTLIVACRRPAKLNSDIEEIANHYFCLSQGGRNDKANYRDIAEGLPDMLDDKEPYEVAHVNSNREIQLFDPVKDMGEKGRI